MLDFLLRKDLSSSVPWLGQIIIILVVIYAIARLIADAREKKYEDRIDQKDEIIAGLKTERDVQMVGLQQQIEALRINVKDLEKKLEREFGRRRKAEDKIMELEKSRQMSDKQTIDLLGENRDLRIALDHYKTFGEHHEPTHS